MRRRDIKEAMRGRWRSILPVFGFSARELSGKHGPCPFCGGKDRWRFIDKDQTGSAICNQCFSGDGFELIMRKLNLDFKSVVARLWEELGENPPELDQAKADMSEENIRERLNRLWTSARPIEAGDEVDRYLHNRGIGRAAADYPKELRFHPHCYVDGVPGVKHLPAMLARVRDPSGQPVQLHRTYIRDGEKAYINSPRRMMKGTIAKGSAVRLSKIPKDGVLGIAEGIETALAATEMWKFPVWAALNTSMLVNWSLPPGVTTVVVAGDNDKNFAGHKAAYSLANRMATQENIEVKVWMAHTENADWADEWMSVRKTSEQGEMR